MKINPRKPSIRKKYKQNKPNFFTTTHNPNKPNFFTTTHNPNKQNQNIFQKEEQQPRLSTLFNLQDQFPKQVLETKKIRKRIAKKVPWLPRWLCKKWQQIGERFVPLLLPTSPSLRAQEHQQQAIKPCCSFLMVIP